MMLAKLLPIFALPLAACGTTQEPAPPTVSDTRLEDTSVGHADVEADLSTWTSERIALPSDFAPDLPAGSELLLFAPGMFDAAAEDFWSYAFALRLEEPLPDDERLTELLELYYDGLISAVAESRGLALEGDPATVVVRRTESGERSADVRLVDAFVTAERLDLHMRIRSEEDGADGCLLRFQASPRDPEHPIWRDLARAVEGLEP